MNETRFSMRLAPAFLRLLCSSIAVVTVLVVPVAHAEQDDALTVAVASNFLPAMKSLSASFESHSGQAVRISSASTGKLYAQIVHGAPFDVLLAADINRPTLLEASGKAQVGSRFTYAVGRLVLWSRDPAVGSGNCLDVLMGADLRRVAIANPDIAPYGTAARETLQKLDSWERLRGRTVVAENIAQALQFVASGNASLGFVAAAQLRLPSLPATSCIWPVPPEYHSAIEQQAVLLARAADKPQAKAFLEFLRGPVARRMIVEHGYDVPDLVSR